MCRKNTTIMERVRFEITHDIDDDEIDDIEGTYLGPMEEDKKT